MLLVPILLVIALAGFIIYKIYRMVTHKEPRSGFNIFIIGVFFMSMASRIKETIESRFELDKIWFYVICFTVALLIGILLKVKGLEAEEFEKSRT